MIRLRSLAGAGAALLLLAGVAACGGDDDDTSTATTAAAGGSTTTAASTGGGTPSGDRVAVTFGALGPLTGPAAQTGAFIQSAMELAEQDIADDPDFADIDLHIQFEDNQVAPGPSVTAMHKLVDVDHVPAVISSGSSATLSVLPIADEEHVVVIQSGAAATSLREASEYLFNGIPLGDQETKPLAEYLVDQGFETAAIAYANDDAGQSVRDAFKRDFEAAGGEVVAEEPHELAATDFRSGLLNIQSKHPDVLFLASYSGAPALLIRQAKELGLDAQLASTTFAATPEVTGSPDAIGMIHTTIAFDPPEDWANRFKDAAGQDATSLAGLYYDAVRILATAAQALAADGQEITGDALRDEIKAIGTFDGVTGTTTFQDDGTSEKTIDLYQITDAGDELVH